VAVAASGSAEAAEPQPTPSRALSRILDRPELTAALGGLVYLPFTLLGYGNDNDVANVLRAGRSWLDGDYEISRRPGSTPVELVSAALDRVGGSVLVNLVSLVAAVVALAALGRILRREGVPSTGLVVLVLAAHPWFWVAATSLADFTWALGLLLAGIDLAQRGRRIPAGLLFGLAIGARATTGLLVVTWLVAEQLGHRERRPALRAAAGTGATALAVAVLCFIPPWLDQGGVEMLEAGLPPSSPAVQLGRWAVKNLAVVGLAGVIVLLAGWRHLAAAGRWWSRSPAVRFGILGFVVAQLAFLRLPLKPGHLLPAVVCVVLVVGVAMAATGGGARRWVWALVASQLLHGVVAVRVAEPDRIDDATGGRLDPAIVAGVLVNDVDCRLDDRERGEWPDPADPAEQDAAEARNLQNYTCQQRPWRSADRPLVVER
jgi:hypothetical protein